MSRWRQYDLGGKITKVLAEVPDSEQPQAFGRPFVMADQLAVLFAEHFPDDVRAIGLPVRSTRTPDTLARYLANQIARHIDRGELPEVEAASLTSSHPEDVSVREPDGTPPQSASGSDVDRCLFRLRPTTDG